MARRILSSIRRIILGVMCASTLVFGADVAEQNKYTSLIDNPVWKESCYWTELATGETCGNMKPAHVLVMPDIIMDSKFGKGVLGFFIPMGNIVYVRASLPEKRQREVILHENVHYILDKRDPFRRKWHRCASEEAARLVTDLYTGRNYSTKWKDWYDCPKTDSPFNF